MDSGRGLIQRYVPQCDFAVWRVQLTAGGFNLFLILQYAGVVGGYPVVFAMLSGSFELFSTKALRLSTSGSARLAFLKLLFFGWADWMVMPSPDWRP
jgi:hypothetical protein